jgi:hypothetical protein
MDVGPIAAKLRELEGVAAALAALLEGEPARLPPFAVARLALESARAACRLADLRQQLADAAGQGGQGRDR